MANEAYLKLLRDPRWQKMRLKILERDGWACTECENEERSLQVHHKRYVWGKKPWDYETDDLATLCEVCHAAATDAGKAIKAAIVHLGTSELSLLAGMAIGMRIKSAWFKAEDGSQHLAPWANDSVPIVNYEMADGIGQIIKMSADDIIRLIEGDELDLVKVAVAMKSPW